MKLKFVLIAFALFASFAMPTLGQENEDGIPSPTGVSLGVTFQYDSPAIEAGNSDGVIVADYDASLFGITFVEEEPAELGFPDFVYSGFTAPFEPFAEIPSTEVTPGNGLNSISAVPEPSSFALVGLSVAAFAWASEPRSVQKANSYQSLVARASEKTIHCRCS